MNENNDNALEVNKEDKIFVKGDLNAIRKSLNIKEHSNTLISMKEKEIIKNIPVTRLQLAKRRTGKKPVKFPKNCGRKKKLWRIIKM